jgi:hypothetical protein
MDLFTLAKLELPDVTGKTHRLGDVWQERTQIVVFLRHFG